MANKFITWRRAETSHIQSAQGHRRTSVGEHVGAHGCTVRWAAALNLFDRIMADYVLISIKSI